MDPKMKRLRKKRRALINIGTLASLFLLVTGILSLACGIWTSNDPDAVFLGIPIDESHKEGINWYLIILGFIDVLLSMFFIKVFKRIN